MTRKDGLGVTTGIEHLNLPTNEEPPRPYKEIARVKSE